MAIVGYRVSVNVNKSWFEKASFTIHNPIHANSKSVRQPQPESITTTRMFLCMLSGPHYLTHLLVSPTLNDHSY